DAAPARGLYERWMISLRVADGYPELAGHAEARPLAGDPDGRSADQRACAEACAEARDESAAEGGEETEDERARHKQEKRDDDGETAVVDHRMCEPPAGGVEVERAGRPAEHEALRGAWAARDHRKQRRECDPSERPEIEIRGGENEQQRRDDGDGKLRARRRGDACERAPETRMATNGRRVEWHSLLHGPEFNRGHARASSRRGGTLRRVANGRTEIFSSGRGRSPKCVND